MAGTMTTVQTASGKLSFSDESLTIQHPGGLRGGRAESILRSAIVGIDHRIIRRPMLWSKGAVNLTIHMQGGERVEIRYVPFPAAAALLAQFGQTLK